MFTAGALRDDRLRLALRADEEHVAAFGGQALEERRGLDEAAERLLQIDDVDEVAAREDERLHLRVPARRAGAEMDPCFEEVLDWDREHR
jgi:hypothetical protein